MDKLTRRAFLHLTGAAALGAVIAACAPRPTEAPKPTEAPAGATQATAAAEPTAAVTSAPQAGGKVIYWHEWSGKDEKAQQGQIDRFVAESGVQVEALSVMDHARIIASMASGNPPDLVMTWDAGAAGTWFANGAIVDLKPLVDKSGYDLKKLHPFGVTAGSMLGHLVGLPLSNYLNTALYWNKKLFTDGGLDPETPPSTWEEARDFSDKLTVEEGGELKRLGFLVNYGQHDAQTTQVSWGGHYYSDDGTQVTPDTPGMIAALNYTRSYYQKYGVEKVQAFANGVMAAWDDSPSSPFYTVAGAMEVTGEWLPTFIESFELTDLDYGVTYMPYPQDMPQNKGIMVANTNPMVIAGAAKNQEGAWQLIQFLYRPEVSAEMLTIVGNASPVMDALPLQAEKVKNAKYKWLLQEVWAKATAVYPYTVMSPIGSLYTDELKRAVDGVNALQQEPEEAMKAVKKKVQPELDAALKKMGAS